MVAVRLTWMAAVGLLAGTVSAAERSTALAVSARVVSAVTVRTPITATWARPVALVARAGGAPPSAASDPSRPSTWVAHVTPEVSWRGTGGPTPLAAAVGDRSRPCLATGCAVTISTAPPAIAPDLVVTFLPDGTPTLIVED